MSTVGCLRCGLWYDPNRPHVCGVIGDDVAKRIEERIDALEQRMMKLEAAPAGSRSEKLQAKASASNDAPAANKPPFDRRTYHAAFMRRWRAKRSAAKALQKEVTG